MVVTLHHHQFRQIRVANTYDERANADSALEVLYILRNRNEGAIYGVASNG